MSKPPVDFHRHGTEPNRTEPATMLSGVFADLSKFSTVTRLTLRSLGGRDVLNSDLLERLQRTTIALDYPTSSSAFLCFFSFWCGDEDAVAPLTSPKMNQTTPDNLFILIRNGGVLLGCSHHICSTPRPFSTTKREPKGPLSEDHVPSNIYG